MARDELFVAVLGGMAVAYAVLLWVDRVHYDDENRAQVIAVHQHNAVAKPAIKGLVLGGSNAVFGLSAEMLSDALHEPWYNASLLNEGYSWSNYRAFVVALSQAIDRDGVMVVVYSSINLHWATAGDFSTASSVDITGRQRWSVRPHRSAASYVESYLRTGSFARPNQRYPLPNEFGDFDFTSFRCTYGGERAEFKTHGADRAGRDLAERARFLRSIFPSARIVVVVPSELAAMATARVRTDFNQALRVSFVERMSQEPFADDVTLLVQESFAQPEQICDQPHHASALGRQWRTQGLIDRLGDPAARQSSGN